MPHLDTFQPYPVNGFPMSMGELRKSFSRNPLTRFLQFFAKRDVVMFHDEFLGKALDTTNWYTVAAGATATTWALPGTVEDGLVRGISGTTAATSGLQLSVPSTFLTGARNAGMMVGYTLSVVTETRIEIGFADALPSVNTTVVNSLSTPTFNTTAKGALFVFDNASSTNTQGLYTIGSGVSAAKVATTSYPTAATMQEVRIQLNGKKAAMWVDGVLVAQPAADAITDTDLLKFVVSHKKSNTTTSNVDINYVILWKDRNN